MVEPQTPDIVSDLRLRVNRQSVIVNAAPPKLDPMVVKEMARLNIEAFAMVPWDDALYRCDIELRPLLDLLDSSVAVLAVSDLMVRLLT